MLSPVVRDTIDSLMLSGKSRAGRKGSPWSVRTSFRNQRTKVHGTTKAYVKYVAVALDAITHQIDESAGPSDAVIVHSSLAHWEQQVRACQDGGTG